MNLRFQRFFGEMLPPREEKMTITINTPYIIGGDASSPNPQIPALDVLGVYVAGDTPNVWTQAQIQSSKAKAFLPIVVPSQTETWWEESKNYSYLLTLVKSADRNLHRSGRVPLVLDIEEAQAEAIIASKSVVDTIKSWIVACSVTNFIPWVYGNEALLTEIENNHLGCKLWLASWDGLATDAGFDGHQWESGSIYDKDVFAPGNFFMAIDGVPVKIVTTYVAPVEEKVEEPTPVEEKVEEPTPVVESAPKVEPESTLVEEEKVEDTFLSDHINLGLSLLDNLGKNIKDLEDILKEMKGKL